MTRYRCTHCRAVFEAGGLRDCCLPAAISEQRRLRALIASARAEAAKDSSTEDLLRRIFGRSPA